jgi:micrococcal nuclease
MAQPQKMRIQPQNTFNRGFAAWFMSVKQATLLLAATLSVFIFFLHGNNPEGTKNLLAEASNVISLETTPRPSTEIRGTAVAISDGDTFTLKDAGNQTYKIRLAGIDAPEKKQDYGSRAKIELSSLIWGKPLTVEIIDTDRYKRNIGRVSTPETGKHPAGAVNLRMVENGMAWHYSQYDKSPELAKAEKKARDAKKGLWEKPGAVAPWKFRKPAKSNN